MLTSYKNGAARLLLLRRLRISVLSLRSASPSSSTMDDEEYKQLRKSTVTSINVLTNDRSVVHVAEKANNIKKKFKREFILPQEAIDGLRNAILTCDRPPKQLQNEADQLAKKLEQRRFPASPEKVKAARDQIKKRLKAAKKDGEDDMNLNMDDEAFGGKLKEAQEYQIRNEVDKLLKKSSFNWRPLEIDSKESAAAYTLARLAPNFAEISRCLEEFHLAPDFVPKSVLDYGSGSGAGFWAVTSHWPRDSNGKDAVNDITLVDVSDAMTRFSMDSIRKGDCGESSFVSPSRPFVHDNVTFRRHLLPSLQTTYDLVIAHRVLCEIGSVESRLQLIEQLWRRTNRFLVLVESSLSDGFEGILEARDFLLTAGIQIDIEKFSNTLQKNNLWSNEVQSVIFDDRLSEFERFTSVRDMIPNEIDIPTVLPTASVFAPCPHDLGCPLSGKSVCSFPIRYRGIRADGKKSEREKDGSETSKFTFVILEKTVRQPNTYAERILKNRQLGGHVTCDVCTAYRGIQRITLSKRHGNVYQKLRPRRDGDVFPLKTSVVASESAFDASWRDARENADKQK